MKTKIIKLSDTHYIGVDNSEIKVGDIVAEKLLTGGYELFEIHTPNDIDEVRQKKVTHSNQPLENINFVDEAEGKIIPKIKPLSLSEVEEAIYGYSVEKMAEKQFPYPIDIKDKNDKIIKTKGVKPFNHAKIERYRRIWCQGFNARKELVKDKFVLSEQQILELIERARVIKDGKDEFDLEGILGLTEVCTHNMDVEHSTSIIKSLLPKTEWEVKFNEQGKIVLL